MSKAHKTPEPILQRERKIFALGKKLVRDGVPKEDLQRVCKQIAGVSNAQNLRYTSQQTMDKVIAALEEMDG